MSTINRCALIVRPKQPYIDWANGVDDGPNSSGEHERTVYLAPDFYNQEEMEGWLREAYEEIFEQELWQWMTAEDTWPKERDFATFQTWFEVEYSSMVVDLCDEPPEWDPE